MLPCETTVANLKWQLSKLGIRSHFSHVVVVGALKEKETKATKVKPLLHDADHDNTIWIGDTEIDILAAREIGVKSCALACGLRTKDYLASLNPDILDSDLLSFSNSSYAGNFGCKL